MSVVPLRNGFNPVYDRLVKKGLLPKLDPLDTQILDELPEITQETCMFLEELAARCSVEVLRVVNMAPESESFWQISFVKSMGKGQNLADGSHVAVAMSTVVYNRTLNKTVNCIKHIDSLPAIMLPPPNPEPLPTKES